MTPEEMHDNEPDYIGITTITIGILLFTIVKIFNL